MSKLTAVKVRNAKAKNKPYKLPDGQGLYFHVSPSGKRTWRYRYRLSGNESTYTLGEYPLMTLEKARIARMEAREMVKSGVNPSLARREQKQEQIAKVEAAKQQKQNGFKFIAQEYIEQQQGRWSEQHTKDVRGILERDVFPFIGDEPVDTVKPPQILSLLRRIEKRGALEIARKALQKTSAIFRYSVQTGRATFNPAADMQGVLKTKRVTHRAAIPKDELPEFFKKLAVGDIHITTKLALKFVILTAVRTGEVRSMTWDDVSFDESLWRIPAEKMKMKTPHIVPLSSQAIAILKRMEALYGGKGLVFPGIRDHSKQLSENTLLYALYRLGYHSRATVHGFRATFSTTANESGLFDSKVVEKALAHEQRNKVEAAYNRSEYIEQRRELMQWWGGLLQKMENSV